LCDLVAGLAVEFERTAHHRLVGELLSHTPNHAARATEGKLTLLLEFDNITDIGRGTVNGRLAHPDNATRL
jgi:hypothetical protein